MTCHTRTLARYDLYDDDGVVLCMGILDEDPAGGMPTTEGQLLVRFPDGTVHACEQHHAWQAFTQDGENLDWCAAAGFVRSPTPLAVLAVRRHGTFGPIIGATFPNGTTLTETHARGVLDAFGGASRFNAIATSKARSAGASAGKSAQRSAFPVGFLSDQETTNFLSQQYRVPTINLDEYEVEKEILQLVSKELCEKHLVLPVSRAGSSLIVAMVDPKDETALEELKRLTGFNIEPVIATERAIRSATDRYYKAI